MKLVRIQSVKPIRNFIVHLEFTDGTSREVDLEPHLRGQIFEPIRNNMELFKSVRVDEGIKTICWKTEPILIPTRFIMGSNPRGRKIQNWNWQNNGCTYHPRRP